MRERTAATPASPGRRGSRRFPERSECGPRRTPGRSTGSYIHQVKTAIAPEVDQAGGKGQDHRHPERKVCEPNHPRLPEDFEAEDSAESAPLWIAVEHQHRDDGHD